MEHIIASPDPATPRAYRAVFFDLDGTLLPMELDEFLGSYFSNLTAYVAGQGKDPQQFGLALKTGIKAMADHPETMTNADAYWEAFFQLVEGDRGEWMALFMAFYEGPFGEIGKNVTPNPATAQALRCLADKGYPLVLATMPMFPQVAVGWRLRWAGVDPALFSRLTTFDNSKSVKPKATYCAENLAACGLAGRDVLMVGNNTVEDLSFAKLGCDTFMVTDHLLDPIDFDLSQVKHGTMQQFAKWAQELPACAAPAQGINAGTVPADQTAKVLATGEAGA